MVYIQTIKKISLSSRKEISPSATIKIVSNRTNLSTIFSLINVKANCPIPNATATINPMVVPQISSAIINTMRGINPGRNFFRRSSLFIGTQVRKGD